MYIGICRSFMATIYESGGSEAEHPEGRVGPEGDPSGGPSPRRTLIAEGNEDRVMADGAAVNGKWYGIGCVGMVR